MSTNKRRGGYLATAEGVKKLKEAKGIKKYTYQQIAEAARETQDKVKRLFNPQWGNGKYKVGEEAVEGICNVLDLRPEEIVSDWYPLETTLKKSLENVSGDLSHVILNQAKATKHHISYFVALKKIEQANEKKWEELNLSNIELTEIPSEIKQLCNLKKLDISNNILTALPLEIKDLHDLEILSASGNRFTILPKETCLLKNLKELYVGGNFIKELSPEISLLVNLKTLALDYNPLEKIPLEISQLYNLKELFLMSVFLKEIPLGITQLANLETLDIRNNEIISIPSEILKLKKLVYLLVTGSNLPIPPEIISKFKEPYTIIRYYFNYINRHRKFLHEAKMLLVGQGNVGKTCLKERLIRNYYDPTRNKTDGIDIEDWKIKIDNKELKVNIWDFGGQEIMHSTHQFFLTMRSLYLLVLDTTQSEEKNRIEYWLKIIQSFGKDAPVIIVGNKADQHPLDIDKRGLQKKYPQIKGFWEVSCKKGTGISELAQFVKQEINQLEHIDNSLPLPWFNIKKQLEELAFEKDYIPYEQYESLCEQEGVEKEDNQRILIRLLNDLGIVLNFQDDPRLEDTHVLNPEWVTNGVYKILSDRNLFVEDRGILTIPTLKRILHQLNKRRYPVRKHLFIIGMMRKFELCFDIEPDKQFLIPDILPKEEPYTGEWNNTLAFEYQYPVLPGSIISRFIVRMNHYIHQKTYWRSGVVLANEGNLALVKADREDKIIKIRIKGKAKTRRNLLTAIRFQFDYIHKTIPGIVPVEKVPLIDHPEIILDYQELLGLEAMEENSVAIGKLKQRIPLRQLLDGIESPGDRLKHDQDNWRRVRE